MEFIFVSIKTKGAQSGGSNFTPSTGALNQTKTPRREFILVSAKGLEPLTNGLKGRCSTIELRAQERLNSITAGKERQ